MKYMCGLKYCGFGAIQPENQLEIQPEKDIDEQHSKLVLRITRDGSYISRIFSQSSPTVASQIIKKWKWDKSTKKMSQCCLCMLISSRQKDSIAIRSLIIKFKYEDLEEDEEKGDKEGLCRKKEEN